MEIIAKRSIPVRQVFELFGDDAIVNYGYLFVYNGIKGVPESRLKDYVKIKSITSVYDGDKVVDTLVNCNMATKDCCTEISYLADLCDILPEDCNIFIERVTYEHVKTHPFSTSIQVRHSGTKEAMLNRFGNEQLSSDVNICGDENCGAIIRYSPYETCGEQKETSDNSDTIPDYDMS